MNRPERLSTTQFWRPWTKNRSLQVRELARLTCIPTTTVYRHLTKSLGFVLKHLRWGPHTLRDTQNAQGATLSNQLLLVLLSIKHHRWHFVTTLDESWFYLSTDHEQIWLRTDQEPPERAKHTIQDNKIMVTTAWNPLGFHLVEALAKGGRFNAEYCRAMSSGNESGSAQRLARDTSLFMQTMHTRTFLGRKSATLSALSA
jgi:hypothetical protein